LAPWFGPHLAPASFGLFGHLPVTSTRLGAARHTPERAQAAKLSTACSQAFGGDVAFDQPQNSILVRTSAPMALRPRHVPFLIAAVLQALSDRQHHETADTVAHLARDAILDRMKTGHPQCEAPACRP
jgi:hypothetical protein